MIDRGPVHVIAHHHIAPQSGIALTLSAGDVLRITDPQGEQVADLIAFAADDRREWLSSGRTIDYANSIYVTTGQRLYSNRSRPMLTVVADTVGRHDLLLTPCSPETFALLYDDAPPDHPSCFGNLCDALAPYGITPDAIPTTFNIFMNVTLSPSGALTIGAPLSHAGDHIDLRAELDLIVGITACSAGKSNNGSFKPIDVDVVRTQAEAAGE
ncbi:MAG: urea carboxylase-associated family protein [Dehalococcoidia bacterium]|nr:urea carboxylase-associated family protein [Dehalococcoidia bacterium]